MSSTSEESQQSQQCSNKGRLEPPQLLPVPAAFQKPEAEDYEQNERIAEGEKVGNSADVKFKTGLRNR